MDGANVAGQHFNTMSFRMSCAGLKRNFELTVGTPYLHRHHNSSAIAPAEVIVRDKNSSSVHLSDLLPVMENGELPSKGTLAHMKQAGQKNSHPPTRSACVICKPHLREKCKAGKSCYKCHASHEMHEAKVGGGQARQNRARKKADYVNNHGSQRRHFVHGFSPFSVT